MTCHICLGNCSVDKWNLDLAHVGSQALLLEHIKKVKAGELRNLE
eukprot:SAG11_NODE_19990_length_454_cov_6.208451_2_plen_44_part_01